MKQFFKYVLATMLGIFAFGLILVIFGIITLITSAITASDNSIKDNSVFVLNLKGMIDERIEEDPLTMLMGGSTTEQEGLDKILFAIDKAKTEDNIKGIYIEAGASFAPDSWATSQAIRKALVDFKKSGKWIVSYGDTYSQAAYYIASVADEIMLNPQGEIDWHGIGGYQMFLKDLLAKVGIKMQLAKVGTYKSAPEMFVADRMSDANRAQTEAYINNIWRNVLNEVSASRHISVEKLNEYADNYTMFDDQKTFVERRLVDKLVYADQAKERIKKRLGTADEESLSALFGEEFNQASVSDLNALEADDSGDEIAIYYAYGDIVQTSGEGIVMGGGHEIVAQDVCKDIEKLAKDDDVKAVVLRINSGGGSAYASEQLWRSIELLKKEKPVVVSMGGMAASGGYYMSCNSNWIVAEPTTLTGSIGIFGMFPDLSELFTQKLGIKFDEVKTNKNTTFGNLQARPINPEEMAMVERYVQRGYQLFIKRVGEGRKMTTEQVDAIGQGHVYTAEDALKIKLVDELGGLKEATKKAAKLAKLKKYHTVSYPEPTDWLTQLINSQTNKNNTILDSKMREELGDVYEPLKIIKTIRNQDRIQARIPYIIKVN
ncbi:MAG: signal peptide peptidase SppA [Prevotella sp.]|nr:signal peptide peptidase SppA [Candidatus Equicola faecalis]